MKTACRECREAMGDLRGREPDEMPAAAKAHLDACPACAAFLAEREAYAAAIAPLAAARQAAAVPDGLADRIVARIQRESVEANAPTARPVPFLLRASTRRYAPLAAGAAVFLAVGLLVSLAAGGAFGLPGGQTPTADKANDLTAAAQDLSGQAGSPETLTPSGSTIATTFPRLVATDPKKAFVADVKAADESLPAAYDVLAASGAMDGALGYRCYLNADGSLTLLLLFPDGSIQDRADKISQVLAPCASSFRIEIIDGKDIGSALQAMGIPDAAAFLSSAAGADARLLRVDLGR